MFTANRPALTLSTVHNSLILEQQPVASFSKTIVMHSSPTEGRMDVESNIICLESTNTSNAAAGI